MSESLSLAAGFSRADLNQDVARVASELGKFSYAQTLASCYPARALTPKLYRQSHLAKRKVRSLYVGPNDDFPKTCPRDCDLLVVMGVGFTRRDMEDVVNTLSQAVTGPQVLVGLPDNPLQGAAQVKEYAALLQLEESAPYSEPGPAREMLKARRQGVEEQLAKKLRPQLNPDNFNWLYRGQKLMVMSHPERDLFYSSVLDSIFSKSPSCVPCGSRADRRQAVDLLLDTEEALQFLFSDSRGGYRVIRDFLVEQGIMRALRDSGNYVVLAVNGYLPPDSRISQLWNELLSALLGNGRQIQRLSLYELGRKFLRAPYGLEISYLNLLLAAAMRRYYPSLYLLREGRAYKLDALALRQAWAQPRQSEILYLPQAPYRSAQALVQILNLFGSPQVAEGDQACDLWEMAQEAVVNWYRSLPPLALSISTQPGQAAYALRQLIEHDKTETARQFVQGLVKAAGFSGLPQGEEVSKFRAWLEGGMEAFRQQEAQAYRQLLERLILQFGGRKEEIPVQPEEMVELLNRRFRSWFERLYPQSATQELGAEVGALVEMYALQPQANLDYWLEVLPQRLGLEGCSQWRQDHTPLFMAKLTKAILALESWAVERLWPLPSDPQEAKAKVSHWMRSVMNGQRLTSAQRESVCLDLLDNLCWSESLAQIPKIEKA